MGLRKGFLPYLEAQVEDGQGDRRQEDGRSSLLEVQRDVPVQLPATAALGVRHLQELRGLVSRRLHGWQWCCHVGQGDLLREEGGGRQGRQEEVSAILNPAAARSERFRMLGLVLVLCMSKR